MPHPPQFDGSTLVSTQELPHRFVPPAHTTAHAPREQTSPLGHLTPQAPQLDGSLVVSAQEIPHWSVPDPQLTEHVPFEQTRPDSHIAPHAPQLLGSLDVSVHCPEHDVSSALQLPPLSAAASDPVEKFEVVSVPGDDAEPHPSVFATSKGAKVRKT